MCSAARTDLSLPSWCSTPRQVDFRLHRSRASSSAAPSPPLQSCASAASVGGDDARDRAGHRQRASRTSYHAPSCRLLILAEGFLLVLGAVDVEPRPHDRGVPVGESPRRSSSRAWSRSVRDACPFGDGLCLRAVWRASATSGTCSSWMFRCTGRDGSRKAWPASSTFRSPGAVDAATRRVATGDWEHWKGEVVWMTLYFSVGVWVSSP